MADPFNSSIDEELTWEPDDDDMEALIGLPEQWYDRYENKWHSRYAALVVDNKDPKKLGRLRVECPRIFGEGLTSPWCEPGMMGADSGQGWVWIPEKGAIVWVDFPEGEPHDSEEHPNWTYGPWFDDTVGLPPHSVETQDDSDAYTRTLKGRGVGFIPTSTYAATYPNWRGMMSATGHMLEFDDTPGQERVQLYHKIGTFLEIIRDGTLYVGSVAKIKAAAVGEMRLAALDTTAALAGNEIGMATTGGTYGPIGWLGQKTKSTEPLVCGNILVAYLTALHGALSALTAAMSAMATSQGASATATAGAWNAMFNDVTLIAAPATKTLMQTAGTAATAEASAATALGAAAATLDGALTLLQSLYFTPSPTSFLSDLWKTAKLVGPPEA